MQACVILDRLLNFLRTKTCSKPYVVSPMAAEDIGFQLGIDWVAQRFNSKTINVHFDSSAALPSPEVSAHNPFSFAETCSRRKPLPAHDEGWFQLNTSSFLSSLLSRLSHLVPQKLLILGQGFLRTTSGYTWGINLRDGPDYGHNSNLCRNCKYSPEMPSNLSI